MDHASRRARSARYARYRVRETEIAALQIDEAVVRIARARGLYALALGEVLCALFATGDPTALRLRREADFARERLGVRPRSMKEWMRLARGCRDRPVLRRAVAAGLVTPRKAMTVFPVAVGDAEGLWTAAAAEMSLKDLALAVRAEGGEVDEDPAGRARWLPLLEKGQETVDVACEAVRLVEGEAVPRWVCLEAMCMEWLGGEADRVLEEDLEKGGCGGARPEDLEAARKVWRKIVRGERGKALLRQLAAIEDARGFLERLERCGETIAGGDPLALLALAQRLARARQGSDPVFGALLERIWRERLWEVLGFSGFEGYCDERLSLSARSARDRVWLERRMRALPSLRAAVKSGKLSYTKALAVAGVATPGDVDAWIAKAASTTCQQTEREARKEKKDKEKASGEVCVYGPAEMMELVDAAIADMQGYAQRQLGEPVDPGRALALIAQGYIRVWWPWIRERAKGRDAARYGILMRHGGCCATPGCSRPAVHVHHVVFRSRGGGEERWNRVGLCAWCHLRGVHGGHLRIEGRAGELLRWEFGTSPHHSGDVWITVGADDVFREGAAPATPRPKASGQFRQKAPDSAAAGTEEAAHAWAAHAEAAHAGASAPAHAGVVR